MIAAISPRQRLRTRAPVPCRSVFVKVNRCWPSSPSKVSADATVSDLTEFFTKSNECLLEFGGYGDVWMGLLETGSIFGPGKVAIKYIRLKNDTDADREKMETRLLREITIWKGLCHPNVVPLLGTVRDPLMGMVSPWMGKGNLHNFLQNGHLTDAQRLRLPCEIARGLSYLHSKGIIHGDLSSGNVLINDDGTACLTDFGLSHLKSNSEENMSFMTTTIGGAVRWQAMELVPPQNTNLYEKFLPDLTFKSDIYSIASVTLQVLSGKVPYFDIPADISVMFALARGLRPNRPPQCHILNDAYWNYLQRCWATVPESRPAATDVYDALLQFHDKALDIPTVQAHCAGTKAGAYSLSSTMLLSWPRIPWQFITGGTTLAAA